MVNLECDVAIIGGGPSGSSTARVIAENGFDVILVEKDEFPGITNICAGGMPRSVIKENGLSTDVIEKKILAEKYYFPWGENIIDFDLITVYRTVFDKCMAEKAVENGARMLTDTLIKEISLKNDGAYLYSDKYIIKSKLVVFADGPNTLAYRKFGIGFRPDFDKTAVSLTCEVEWRNNPLNECLFYFGEDIVPWGYGWIFPKKNTVNVGVVCLHNKLRSNLIDSLNYMLKKFPATSELLKGKDILRINSALIPAAPAKKIFGERILVVGDAAGMVDPITSGGIVQAINGGKLAGKICCLSLERGDYSAKFLSQYQNIWNKTADYHSIYSKFLASNIFLYLSKFDRNSYSKLAEITREGIGKVLRRKLLYNPNKT